MCHRFYGCKNKQTMMISNLQLELHAHLLRAIYLSRLAELTNFLHDSMCGVPACLNFDTYTVAANLNMEQSFPVFSSTSSGTNYSSFKSYHSD